MVTDYRLVFLDDQRLVESYTNIVENPTKVNWRRFGVL